MKLKDMEGSVEKKKKKKSCLFLRIESISIVGHQNTDQRVLIEHTQDTRAFICLL